MLVKPEDFGKALNNYLENYVEDIEDDVTETTDTMTREAREELKRISPVGETGRYHKGWTIKQAKKGKHKYSRVIWNRTDYQLTHLLEFGHVKRNGTGWVEAEPHIRPTEKKYKVKFTETLEKKIRRQK